MPIGNTLDESGRTAKLLKFAGAVTANMSVLPDDVIDLYLQDLEGIPPALLRGFTERDVRHFVDCGEETSCPPIFDSVEECHGFSKFKLSRKDNDLFVQGKKVYVYQSIPQKGGGSVDGSVLLNDLKERRHLPVHVLECLRAHKVLIPEISGSIYFCGTHYYRQADGIRFVRGLRYRGKIAGWVPEFKNLNSLWGPTEFMAII